MKTPIILGSAISDNTSERRTDRQTNGHCTTAYNTMQSVVWITIIHSHT